MSSASGGSDDAPDEHGYKPAGIFNPVNPEQDRKINELSKTVAQLLIEKARSERGRKRGGRAPDMATETFSALAVVLLRRGVDETQLLGDLIEAYRLYGIPNLAKRANETLALAKQRSAE